MRIARFTTGEDPQYGVISGELDAQGQLDDDAVVVALAGDPLYVGIKLLEEEHRLADNMKRDIVARLRHLADMPDIEPFASEYPLFLPLEHGGIEIHLLGHPQRLIQRAPDAFEILCSE